MRRRRIKISPVPDEVYLSVSESPHRVFQFLDELQLEVPTKASFMLLCMKLTRPKYDIRFYQEQQDFLLDYTSCLLKDREDYEFHAFKKDDNVDSWELWEMFLPPPVIGLGIRTSLRPGVDPV